MENTVSWNLPNLITVTLMVMLTLFVAAVLFRTGAAIFGRKTSAPVATEQEAAS